MLNNHSLMRENNVHLILSQIINYPGISRSKISTNIGINKATVSEIVKKLIAESYVIESGTGEGSSSGGRKPILLRINKKSGISISFDVRSDRISYMVNYLNGNIIKINSIDTIVDKKNVITIIKEIVSGFKKEVKDMPFGIIGITIAIHGIISDNEILFTPYYNLSHIDLAKVLEDELKIPIYLENEANLAGLAEATLDGTHNNLISCSIHTGVGAGVIINKKLYRGFEGRSGEIGHTTLYPGGIQCPCGNKGCFEQYCSQSAVINFYRKAKQDSMLTIENLVEDYNNDDFVAKKIIEEFSKNLSIGIGNLIGTYGPEVVYINSDLLEKLPITIEKIQNYLSETIYKNTPIKITNTVEKASLYGATVLNIQNFLEVDSINLSFESEKLTP